MQVLHATPTPNTSYASAVRSRPVMCSVAIHTEPEAAAPVTHSACPSVPSICSTSLPITPSPVSSQPSACSTSLTDIPTVSSCSQAAAASTSVRPKQKSDNKSTINLTTLSHQKSRSHVLPAVTPTRERRASSSSGESGGLVIDDTMDVSVSKNRNRSPGGRSPGGG